MIPTNYELIRSFRYFLDVTPTPPSRIWESLHAKKDFTEHRQPSDQGEFIGSPPLSKGNLVTSTLNSKPYFIWIEDSEESKHCDITIRKVRSSSGRHFTFHFMMEQSQQLHWLLFRTHEFYYRPYNFHKDFTTNINNRSRRLFSYTPPPICKVSCVDRGLFFMIRRRS